MPDSRFLQRSCGSWCLCSEVSFCDRQKSAKTWHSYCFSKKAFMCSTLETRLFCMEKPTQAIYNRASPHSEARLVLNLWSPVCSAFFCGNGIPQVQRSGLHLVAQFVVWLLCTIGRETRRQAVISRRSRTNVFDLLNALLRISPTKIKEVLEGAVVFDCPLSTSVSLQKINKLLRSCNLLTTRRLNAVASSPNFLHPS